MKRLTFALVLLLTSVSLASADPPFTRRSSQMQHDGLKQYYEIANFRLGGRYDLADPSKWENGGEGGVTLESLGGGKLRTAYIAIGTPRRNAAGEITNAVIINSYYSGDSSDMFEQWVKGTALSTSPSSGRDVRSTPTATTSSCSIRSAHGEPASPQTASE